MCWILIQPLDVTFSIVNTDKEICLKWETIKKGYLILNLVQAQIVPSFEAKQTDYNLL